MKKIFLIIYTILFCLISNVALCESLICKYSGLMCPKNNCTNEDKQYAKEKGGGPSEEAYLFAVKIQNLIFHLICVLYSSNNYLLEHLKL